jgi:CheY-like chemotaxis protein
MQSKAENTSDRDDYADYRVLLVEDDAIMRMSLEDRLRLEGIPTTAVGDVASARRGLKHGDIDLVITDIRLPDGTGHELFDTITTYSDDGLWRYFRCGKPGQGWRTRLPDQAVRYQRFY